MNPMSSIHSDIDKIYIVMSNEPETDLECDVKSLITKVKNQILCVDDYTKRELRGLAIKLGKHNYKSLNMKVQKLLRHLSISNADNGALQQIDEEDEGDIKGSKDERDVKVSRQEKSPPPLSKHVDRPSAIIRHPEESRVSDNDTLLQLLFLSFSPQKKEKFLRTMLRPNKGVDTLSAAAKKGDLNDPVFDSLNTESLALAAVIQQKLSITDYFSIIMYCCLLRCHHKDKIKTVNLFAADGSVVTGARALLKTTMEVSSFQAESFTFNTFTEEQFAKFYEELIKLSPLQRQFWVVETQIEPIYEFSSDWMQKILQVVNKNVSVIKEILNQTGLNTFNQTPNPRARMIPNLSMVQVYLNTKHTHPVQLKPIIGCIEDVENLGEALQHHDVNTCFVSLAVPSSADFPYQGYDNFTRVNNFNIHYDYDLTYYTSVYRGELISAIPPARRQMFVNLAGAIRKVCQEPEYQQNEDIATLSTILYKQLMRMEFGRYWKQQKSPSNLIFLDSLREAFQAKFLHHLTHQMLRRNIEKTKQESTQENVLEIVEHGKWIMKQMYQNKELLNKISREFLAPYKSSELTPEEIEAMTEVLKGAITEKVSC